MGSSDHSAFKGWYEANKESISERRKAQYASDPTRREKAIAYQRTYRDRKGRASTRGQPHFRAINGRDREVVRIASAASTAGCSIEFIRKYEAKGVIPKPLVDSAQRYYTLKQVDLISAFYAALVLLKYSKDERVKTNTLEAQKSLMHHQWNGE